jgi:hypothetical protein
VATLVVGVYFFGHLDLSFAFFLKLLIPDGMTRQFLGLSNDHVLPGGRGVVRFVRWCGHESRLDEL